MFSNEYMSDTETARCITINNNIISYRKNDSYSQSDEFLAECFQSKNVKNEQIEKIMFRN